MAKLKPIERLADDVRKGDLVRIFTNRIKTPSSNIDEQFQTEYTGYIGHKEGETVHFQSPPRFINNCRYVLFNKKTNTLKFDGNSPDTFLIAESYEILRRAKR